MSENFTTRQEVQDKVIETIATSLGLEESGQTITPRSDLIDDLGADSLDSVEIMMELEEIFGIEVDDNEQENINTVNDVVDLVCDELNIKK